MASNGNDLLALVREKQAQLAKLQAELDEVRRLLNGDGADGDAQQEQRRTTILRLRELGGGGTPLLPGVAVRGPGGRRAGRQSSVALAEDAIRQNGGPMHIDDMIVFIGTKHGETVNKQTLVSNLARLTKKGVFRRTGPNTFDLGEAGT